MALGTRKNLVGVHDAQGVVEAALGAPWITAIDAGGMDDQDAATITDPDTNITLATRHIFERDMNRGMFVTARMVYDDGISGVTDPVVKLFGRHNSDDMWQILENLNGDIAVTIPTDLTNDVSDGTLNFTHPDGNTHVWDCFGCNEFLFGVETKLSATGIVTTAYLEVKVI